MKGLIKQKLVKNEQKEEEEARRKKSWRSGFGRSEMSLREMAGVVYVSALRKSSSGKEWFEEILKKMK
jgi:hypothetical protein